MAGQRAEDADELDRYSEELVFHIYDLGNLHEKHPSIHHLDAGACSSFRVRAPGQASSLWQGMHTIHSHTHLVSNQP